MNTFCQSSLIIFDQLVKALASKAKAEPDVHRELLVGIEPARRDTLVTLSVMEGQVREGGQTQPTERYAFVEFFLPNYKTSSKGQIYVQVLHPNKSLVNTYQYPLHALIQDDALAQEIAEFIFFRLPAQSPAMQSEAAKPARKRTSRGKPTRGGAAATGSGTPS